MKNFIFSLLLLLFSITNLSAKEIAGINIPETYNYAGKTMQLNGAGIRKKLFLKLYVGSLYLSTKSKDAKQIIQSDTPMAIRLNITSSLISPKKMKEATLEGFKKSTHNNIAPIKPQIDSLLATFDKGVSKGDSYELINLPNNGVDVLRNGEKVANIKSPEFKAALFGIWLSDSPVQADLKKAMLGNL